MSIRKILGYFKNSITGCGVFLLLLGVEFFAGLRTPTDSVPAWFVYLSQLTMIIICCVVYACLRHRYDTGRFSVAIPVRYIGLDVKGVDWVVLVENTPVLEINRIVSICYQSKDNDIETTIGLGYVETKNDMNNFQIKVLRAYCRVGWDLQKLGYKLLTVKPVVDKDWLS